MHELMSRDPEFWYKRPLSKSSIKYAAEDVNKLPRLHAKFWELFDQFAGDEGLNALGIFDDITAESEIANDLAQMNMGIDSSILRAGDQLLGLVRNIKEKVAFVGLNIDKSG